MVCGAVRVCVCAKVNIYPFTAATLVTGVHNMLRYVRRVHWDEIRWMRQMWDVCILGDWVWTHTHTLDWWISSCVCVCVYTILVFWTLKFVAWIIATCAPKIESICYWQREEWRPKRPKWTMSVTKFNLMLSRWFCGFRLSKYLSLSACSSAGAVHFNSIALSDIEFRWEWNIFD